MNNKRLPTKKLDYKKSLVRNPVLTKPKTVVIQQPERSAPNSILPETPSETQISSIPSTVPAVKAKFDSPTLHSALKIVSRIESIENTKPRKIMSIAEVNKKKLSIVHEKASKQVNFPYNQPIYRDLIPLCTKSQPPLLPSVSREIPMYKDEEPILSNFFTPKVLPEYSFKVPVQPTHQAPTKQVDGFKLYRMIRKWN